MQQLRDLSSSPATSAGLPAGADNALDRRRLLAAVSGCARALARSFDPKLGGFGGPPKFPRPSELNLLLRSALEPVGHPQRARMCVDVYLYVCMCVTRGLCVCTYVCTHVCHGMVVV